MTSLDADGFSVDGGNSTNPALPSHPRLTPFLKLSVTVLVAWILMLLLRPKMAARFPCAEDSASLLIGVALGGALLALGGEDEASESSSRELGDWVGNMLYDYALPMWMMSSALLDRERRGGTNAWSLAYTVFGLGFHTVFVSQSLAILVPLLPLLVKSTSGEPRENWSCLGATCVLWALSLAPVHAGRRLLDESGPSQARRARRLSSEEDTEDFLNDGTPGLSSEHPLEEEGDHDGLPEDPTLTRMFQALRSESLLSTPLATTAFSLARDAAAGSEGGNLRAMWVGRVALLGGSSALMGVILGHIAASAMRFRDEPHIELVLMALFGFAAKLLADLLGFSAVLTGFALCLTMSHTTLYCVSDATRVTLLGVCRAVETLVESLSTMYVGTSMVGSFLALWRSREDARLVLVVAACVLAARAGSAGLSCGALALSEEISAWWRLRRAGSRRAQGAGVFRSAREKMKTTFPVFWLSGLRGFPVVVLATRASSEASWFLAASALVLCSLWILSPALMVAIRRVDRIRHHHHQQLMLLQRSPRRAEPAQEEAELAPRPPSRVAEYGTLESSP